MWLQLKTMAHRNTLQEFAVTPIIAVDHARKKFT